MSSLCKSASSSPEDDHELRRGPWSVEEDTLLIHYIERHGEGRWNLLAKRSGLKRTGKSCRLRWLNYLKPDVKRGNLTPQEQISILQLHSKWGNRWSKIAQELPGRTDNEIKNYWRTRVQKQARHLKIDANSTAFQDVIRCFWMPTLLQKINYGSSSSPSNSTLLLDDRNPHYKANFDNAFDQYHSPSEPPSSSQPPEPSSEYGTSTSSSQTSLNNNISQVSHQFSEYPTSPFQDFVCHVNNYNNNNNSSSGYDMTSMPPTMPAGEDNNWDNIDEYGLLEDNYMWIMQDELWQFRNSSQGTF